MATRDEVFDAINSERNYQDTRWPGHEHEIASYLTYMQSYLNEAINIASKTAALDALRKVVTLGVKCMEEHGAPLRK